MTINNNELISTVIEEFLKKIGYVGDFALHKSKIKCIYKRKSINNLN